MHAIRGTTLVVGWMATMLVTAPVALARQSELRLPRWEIGLETEYGDAFLGESGPELPGGTARFNRPRVTINWTPRVATDFFGDRVRSTVRDGHLENEGTRTQALFAGQARIALFQFSKDRGRLSSTLGGGFESRHYHFPEHAAFDRDLAETVVVPARSRSLSTPVLFSGIALSHRIGSHASIYAEARMFLAGGYGRRAVLGVSLPLGQYPPASSRAPLLVRRDFDLRIGQRVAMRLANGEEAVGVVRAVSDQSLELEHLKDTVVPLSEIRRIDVWVRPTDGLRKGAGYGFGIGLLGALLAVAPMVHEDDMKYVGGIGLGVILLGTGIGAALGLAVDARQARWQRAYEVGQPGAVLSVSPQIGRRSAGLRALVRW